MLLYITNPEETHPQALQLLKAHGIQIVLPSEAPEEQAQVEAVFIRSTTQADRAWLAQFPHLHYVLCAAVGIDNIDRQACQERDIEIINAPGANAAAVAEHALTLMLMLLKKIPHHTRTIQQGGWRDLAAVNDELKGKTIGLIGCGAVGQRLARLCRAFDVGQLIGYDPFANASQLKTLGVELSDLATVFRTADIVSIQVPLTSHTHNLITSEQLKLLKPSSLVINVSRGKIVNETDLIQVLQARSIAGAGLDVFDQEPHPNPILLHLDNVVVTPHIGGFTTEARQAMSLLPVQQFLKRLMLTN